MERKCGILLPITSLPSRYGIGCFSKEAFEFVDFLAEAGQTYWQILPLGQTGYGDSPYQSFSTFAGNPYFIDPQELIDAGYISAEAAGQFDFGREPRTVDYEMIYRNRYTLLRKAYANSPFCINPSEKWADDAYDDDRMQLNHFIGDNLEWLPDYALFSAVKEYFDGDMFTKWPEEIRLRNTAAMDSYRIKLDEEIRFYEFLQFLFAKQWKKLKSYANDKGIKIIGDIPIYVAFDSADTWSHPELFELDEKGFPTVVAGVPPDAFSETGQLWGNPIYRWKFHKATGFDWWMQRLEQMFRLYDVVRIDHFRGFDEYWAVPYGHKDAMGGKWCKGPGYALFKAMKERLGDKEIIAEDLNDTTRGWYMSSDSEQLERINKYAGISCSQEATWELIRLAMQSVADTAIIPIQDYLDYGSAARINTPSTLGGNWCWRLVPGELTQELADKMREFASIYGRIRK